MTEIMRHHANGRFDWLTSGHRSVNSLKETTSILSGKYKRFTFVHPVPLMACSHEPGTTHYPGQLTNPWVNFASVHGLTHVTVHMNLGQLITPGSSLIPGSTLPRCTI